MRMQSGKIFCFGDIALKWAALRRAHRMQPIVLLSPSTIVAAIETFAGPAAKGSVAACPALTALAIRAPTLQRIPFDESLLVEA